MSFGKRLRARRDDKGYTREDVASRLGVSFSAVQKWENDERRPTLAMAGKIAELFGTTVSEIVGDSFDKPSLEDDWPEVAQYSWIDLDAIRDLVRVFDVSYEAMQIRLSELGLCDPAYIRHLWETKRG